MTASEVRLQEVVDTINRARLAHPEGEVEVVVEARVTFVLNLAWSPGEPLSAEDLQTALDENAAEMARLVDWKGVAVPGAILEVRDLESRQPIHPAE